MAQGQERRSVLVVPNHQDLENRSIRFYRRLIYRRLRQAGVAYEILPDIKRNQQIRDYINYLTDTVNERIGVVLVAFGDQGGYDALNAAARSADDAVSGVVTVLSQFSSPRPTMSRGNRNMYSFIDDAKIQLEKRGIQVLTVTSPDEEGQNMTFQGAESFVDHGGIGIIGAWKNRKTLMEIVSFVRRRQKPNV